MIVSPSLHSILEERSITCCAPEVIISLSYSFVMEYLSSKYFLSVFLKGIYPSVILYCNAQVGSSLKISFTILDIFSTGKVSGDGLPAENEIIFGSLAYLRISLIADDFRLFVLLEN